jgi:hypothetical protein
VNNRDMIENIAFKDYIRGCGVEVGKVAESTRIAKAKYSSRCIPLSVEIAISRATSLEQRIRLSTGMWRRGRLCTSHAHNINVQVRSAR